MNRIGRRTAYAILVILVLAIVWQTARIDLATHGMGWPEDIECEEVKAEVEVRSFPSA